MALRNCSLKRSLVDILRIQNNLEERRSQTRNGFGKTGVENHAPRSFFPRIIIKRARRVDYELELRGSAEFLRWITQLS